MKNKWLVIIFLGILLFVGSGQALAKGIRPDLSNNPFHEHFNASATTAHCGTISNYEQCKAPEIEVTGNNVLIPDGDSIPSLSDHTDFGDTPVSGGILSREFTISNVGDGSLTLTGTPKVILSGTHAADLSVSIQPSGSIAAGGSTTFTVLCDPSAVGLRTASVFIDNNDSNENPYNFSVQCTGISDTNPNVLSITRAGPDNTSAASVNFTLTFSEPVTGVDTSAPFTDFILTTTGAISGAAVTGVVDSGDHITYTVTVNTGTGNGTIRLDVAGSGTGIQDLSGNPLAGGFTTGEVYTIIKTADFGKTAPADGATGQSLSPTLSWESAEGATSYEYCYSSAPGPCTAWHSVGNNTSVMLNNVAANYTYHWQVRAISASGTTEADGGAWWSFTTQTTPACTWPAYTAPSTPTFADVPIGVPYWSWVERLYNSGITAGCGGGNFCPDSGVNRVQTAIFLLRGIHCGSSYTPPPVGDSTGFNDVPVSASYAPWVKQLAAEGITNGCGGGNFCPGDMVSRAQMAIFLLRSKHGSTYSPPAVGDSTGFNDMPASASYAAWVKQLAADGLTAGCGGGNYCPEATVSRVQMAIFLVRTFNLP